MPEEAGGVNAAELAAEAASEAVGATSVGELVTGVQDPGELLNIPPQEADIGAIDEEALAAAAAEQAGEAAAVPVIPAAEVTPEPEIDQVFVQLQELGIDLGLTRADLPEELHPSYELLATQAVQAAQVVAERLQQLEVSQMEMKQFAQKMQEDPQKVLLTMAVTNPEAFQEAITTFEEMQTDERTKDLVVRELQAEARLAAADRQAQMYQSRALNSRVAEVETATKNAAARYNVDLTLAQKFVAMRISAGGTGDIDISAVDGVVAQLKPAMRTPVATPAKQAAAAQAPNVPLAGAGTSASAVADEVSPGLTTGSRNPLMALVKAASAKVARSED